MRTVIKAAFVVFAASMILCGCKKSDSTTNENPSTAPIESADVVETMNSKLIEKTDYLDRQAGVDRSLQEEAGKGYSFDEPMVIVNPYGSSPLTAVVIFTTPSDMGGSIIVEGKSDEDDIKGSFAAEKEHIVPIYGLYAGDTTKVTLTLEDGTSNTLEIKTDQLNYSTDGFEVEMLDSSSYDYSRLTFACSLNGSISALDSKGDLRWIYSEGGFLGVKALSNGRLAVPTGYTLKPMYYQSGILEMDLLGKIYKEYAISGGMHHDIFELKNGNLLVAADRPSFDTLEDYIVEIDRKTGEVVWELDLMELIDPTEGGSIHRSDEDWFHNNGVWYDEASDTLLLSGRHVDAITAVDKSEKKLKWILGDPEGWSEEYQQYFFQPIGDNFEWQYAQHEVSMLPNGNIMCFDNGAGRTKVTKEDQKVTGDNVYSRAVIYRINEENRTIEQVWQYGKELGGQFYSEWISGAESLDDSSSNIWITAGSNLYNLEKGDYDYGPQHMFAPGIIQSTNIVQVKDNQPVYKMKPNFLTYRSLRLLPYEDAGAYDVSAAGQYLGSLGVTGTVDMEVKLGNASSLENCTVSLDPVKLTYTAAYDIAAKDDLKDDYLVLRRADGTIFAYQAQQSTVENEDNVTVNVSGWVSMDGLTGTAYDVFLILNNKAYNTGYRIEP